MLHCSWQAVADVARHKTLAGTCFSLPLSLPKLLSFGLIRALCYRCHSCIIRPLCCCRFNSCLGLSSVLLVFASWSLAIQSLQSSLFPRLEYLLAPNSLSASRVESTNDSMRYGDWDILLFPRDGKVPLKEFKVACHMVRDPGLSLSQS